MLLVAVLFIRPEEVAPDKEAVRAEEVAPEKVAPEKITPKEEVVPTGEIVSVEERRRLLRTRRPCWRRRSHRTSLC